MTAISIRVGKKSYERARFAGERTLFVRIVVFGLVFAGPFNVLHCMDQVAVRNHGMMGGLLEFTGAVIFSGAALVLGGMLEQFGGFQMMIDAFLGHVFRIANAGNLKLLEDLLLFGLLDHEEMAQRGDLEQYSQPTRE
jgi:hypothetical protein